MFIFLNINDYGKQGIKTLNSKSHKVKWKVQHCGRVVSQSSELNISKHLRQCPEPVMAASLDPLAIFGSRESHKNWLLSRPESKHSWKFLLSRVSDGFWEPWHLLGFYQGQGRCSYTPADLRVPCVLLSSFIEMLNFLFQQALAPFCVFVMIFSCAETPNVGFSNAVSHDHHI